MEEFYPDIAQIEQGNEGMDIHLFFNSQVGCYTAYGVSAFLVDHFVEGFKSFSTTLQLPVVLLPKGEVISLSNATVKISHDPQRYYHLRLRQPIGLVGYERWASILNAAV